MHRIQDLEQWFGFYELTAKEVAQPAICILAWFDH